MLLYSTVHLLIVYSAALQTLEEDFVEMRKGDTEMNAETFHQMLSVARYSSCSLHSKSAISQLQFIT